MFDFNYSPGELLPTMSPEAERAYVVILQGLSKIQEHTDQGIGLDCANAAMRAALDWTQLNIGPEAAQQLCATEAGTRWNAMKLAKKRSAA